MEVPSFKCLVPLPDQKIYTCESNTSNKTNTIEVSSWHLESGTWNLYRNSKKPQSFIKESIIISIRRIFTYQATIYSYLVYSSVERLKKC